MMINYFPWNSFVIYVLCPFIYLFVKYSCIKWDKVQSASHFCKINPFSIIQDHLVGVYFAIMTIWLYIVPYLTALYQTLQSVDVSYRFNYLIKNSINNWFDKKKKKPLVQSCNFKEKAMSEMSEYQKQNGANQIALVLWVNIWGSILYLQQIYTLAELQMP